MARCGDKFILTEDLNSRTAELNDVLKEDMYNNPDTFKLKHKMRMQI